VCRWREAGRRGSIVGCDRDGTDADTFTKEDAAILDPTDAAVVSKTVT